MEKSGYNNNRIPKVFKVFLIAAFAASVFMLIIYHKIDGHHALEKSYVTYIKDWTVIDPDGNSFEAEEGYQDDRIREGDFTIVATLPDNIPDGSYVCYIARCAQRVYIDGELRKEFDQYRDMPLPGGTVKNFYMLTPVNHADSGRELKIFKGKIDRGNKVIPETFIAGRDGLYEVLMQKYGVSFVASAILLFISSLVLIVGIGMRISYKHSISMQYAALGSCVTALWLISNSYLYPFAFGHYHIDGIVNYLACMLLPFGFLLYIDSIQKGRYSKVFNMLMAISLVSFVLWTVLHFTGIFTFPNALVYIDAVMAIDIIGAFVPVILDIKNGYAKEYKYTVVGFLLFFVFSLGEIYVILFAHTRNESIPLLIGIMILLGFVLWQQVQDLSNLTYERERAVQLSNAKTTFLANMSHEIRTPINSILGMNEMIIRENHDLRIDEYARNVQTSGKMLLSLVNDVLDFSQLEADKMKIMNEDVSLAAILADISAMARERAANKGLTFNTVLDGEVPDGLHTDEVRLKQILINLLNNAVKYTDEGSVTLSVGGRSVTDKLYELRLSVKDTGRGIRDEDKERLFDAFSRADLTRNRNIEGTGLGLAIVKRILDAMDGTITVESEYKKGTVFDVLVPVTVTDSTPVDPDLKINEAVSARENDDVDFRAPGVNVLAVDDNKSNLEIVRMFLERVDIRPTLCRGGREAVEMCYDHKYDLLLLDHMMPEMDGIEALKIIRKDKYSLNRETPALVLTANAVMGSDKMYKNAGFEGYLTKPIDSKKLLLTVKEFLPADKIMKQEPNKGIKEEKDIKPEKNKKEGTMGLIDKLKTIEEMDFNEALTNCGGDEGILEIVIGDILSDSDERTEKMRNLIKEGNYKDFGIEAHALKGLMATIGVRELSERAKQHEFASKEGNIAFIDEDYEGLLDDFKNLCEKMR